MDNRKNQETTENFGEVMKSFAYRLSRNTPKDLRKQISDLVAMTQIHSKCFIHASKRLPEEMRLQ